ncbi:MAG: hypothetical protein ACYSU0_15925 [Planctomycetota bacterium]|jgi:hypothetical protein
MSVHIPRFVGHAVCVLLFVFAVFISATAFDMLFYGPVFVALELLGLYLNPVATLLAFAIYGALLFWPLAMLTKWPRRKVLLLQGGMFVCHVLLVVVSLMFMGPPS